MRNLINKYFTHPLHAKTLLWKKHIRIFCDGGQPKWFWIPRFCRNLYNPHWKMFGFMIQIFGRQIFFSFGEDVNKLYDRNKQNDNHGLS